jgi:hypothetical protein
MYSGASPVSSRRGRCCRRNAVYVIFAAAIALLMLPLLALVILAL